MPNWNIVGKRKIFFTISIVITLIGIIAFFINGVQADIQFAGGTVIQYQMNDDKFETSYVIELVKKTLDKSSNAFKLSTYNTKDKNDNINLLKIQISSAEGVLNTEEISNLDTAIKADSKLNINEKVDYVLTNIKPSIGTEYRNKSLLAILLSSLCIVAYITLRFKLMSGIPAGITAVIALLHDVAIMLTVYMLFKIPINENFIAAILTVIGYSINDTIIIYDRIRENMNKLRKVSSEELVNISILQTLTRSINTVLTVLIAIITLYVFAKIYNIESIQQFSFPLIVGIISGAYSSIFIASPLWVMWMNAKKKNKNVKKGRVKTA